MVTYGQRSVLFVSMLRGPWYVAIGIKEDSNRSLPRVCLLFFTRALNRFLNFSLQTQMNAQPIALSEPETQLVIDRVVERCVDDDMQAWLLKQLLHEIVVGGRVTEEAVDGVAKKTMEKLLDAVNIGIECMKKGFAEAAM